MSSMKQVVYAGAFGAVVTMQGCGDGAADGATQVDATGTQTFEEQVQSLASDGQAKVQEAFQKFDTEKALKQITDLATKQGIDVEHLKGELKEVSNMSSDDWSQKANAAIASAKNAAPQLTDELTKGFALLTAEVESIIKDVTVPVAKDYTETEAKDAIIAACKLTVKDFDKKKAIELVQAASAMQKHMKQGEHCAAATEAFKNCKAGFKTNWMPCLNTSYKVVNEKEMKIKQNLEVEPVKGKKAPAAKTILEVMPTSFPANSAIPESLDYIVKQLNIIQPDSKKPTDFKGPVMALMQAIHKTNAPLKKEAAKKAVDAGKKEAAKTADKKAEVAK